MIPDLSFYFILHSKYGYLALLLYRIEKGISEVGLRISMGWREYLLRKRITYSWLGYKIS